MRRCHTGTYPPLWPSSLSAPQWQRARDLVQGGTIGTLIHVDVAFSYDNRTDKANIRNRADTGGGGLPDIGVYAFGSVRFVTGEEPEAVPFASLRFEEGVEARSPKRWAFHTSRSAWILRWTRRRTTGRTSQKPALNDRSAGFWLSGAP